MDLNSIINCILAAAPSVVAILTSFGVVAKIIGAFGSLRKEVQDKTEMKEIQDQFKIVLQENYELKKSINELIEKIDKVKK